jgi:hypothetical protein
MMLPFSIEIKFVEMGLASDQEHNHPTDPPLSPPAPFQADL